MIPSSTSMGGKETTVNRKLSQKDIAALHTGSNSMQQFAEQFGTTHIKQADRSPEDAERIGRDYLDDMYATPEDYVADADGDKLDYSVRMSDGKPFDINNPVHFLEADAITFASVQAQTNDTLRNREAGAITRQRHRDLEDLVKNLGDFGGYTYVEQALVAKAASKFAVLSDKNGRLKLAAIEPNNRHNVAVVSAEDAGKVIEELRAGKPLKQAFLDGMQARADENALANQTKNGWQKFEQPDGEPIKRVIARPVGAPAPRPVARPVARPVPGAGQTLPSLKPVKNPLEEVAEKLAAAAAGTPWCTSGVGTARTQIKNGDFYIYYDKGVPQVAVRMDGTDRIGEIRGNSPNQALTQKQADIAENFIRSNTFKKGDEYLEQLERKRFFATVAKGQTDVSAEQLLHMKGVFNKKGELQDYVLRRALDFSALDGYYRGRPDAPDAVQDFFADKLLQTAKKMYEDGHWVYSAISTHEVGKDNRVKTEFAGVKFSKSLNEIKSLYDLTVSTTGEIASMPVLRNIDTLYMFGQKNITSFSLPVAANINTINFFNTGAKLELPPSVKIDDIRPNDSDLEITITGVKSVNKIFVRGNIKNNDRFKRLTMPDLEYARVDSGEEAQIFKMEQDVGRILEDRANQNNFSYDFDDWNELLAITDNPNAPQEDFDRYNAAMIANRHLLDDITDAIVKHTTVKKAEDIYGYLDLDPFSNAAIVMDNVSGAVYEVIKDKAVAFKITTNILKEFQSYKMEGGQRWKVTGYPV
jgi:hypothetical protein